jgi:Tol biopolymer transport system component
VSLTRVGAFAQSLGLPGISFDGRLVSFVTDTHSTDMASAGDPNSGADVFVRDMVAGTNMLVSVNYSGMASGNGASSNAVMSPNGRWVAFITTATDLLEPVMGGGSGDAPRGLYVRDLGSNTARFIGASSNSTLIVRGEAVFAPDSEWIGFATANSEIHVRSLVANAHRLVCSDCGNPALSSEARFVAFETVPTSGARQVLVRNTATGAAKLLSANINGVEGNGHSTSPRITPNGRFIAYQSTASDLVENDENRASDIFLADRVLGTRVLVSVNKAGNGAGNGPSSLPIFSADGRTLVFQSFASDLVEHDYNDTRDVFVARLSELDSDNDGMDDDFEAAYFGNLDRDGTMDFDGDGQTDAEEFRAGTNPTDNASILRVLTIGLAEGGAKSVIWSASAGRSYRVQYKEDLAANWSDLPGQVVATGSTASKSDPNAVTASHRFYRVLLAE